MEEMISVKEAARRWERSERTVSSLCHAGKIPGAQKCGRSWLLPADAQLPAYKFRKAEHGKQLPLPIGISDYIIASTQYYYVDKTLLIRNLLDKQPAVSLFTRPRRFGKTLNMDMLRVFFEKTEDDTSLYFKNKNIWKCGKAYQSHQGRYPVIYISFKDVKYNTWSETLEDIGNITAMEYKRHPELLASIALDRDDKDFYQKIVARKASGVELSHAPEYLSRMLHLHYGERAVIIIDEYDTPIQQGYTGGFYEEVIRFLRNYLSGCLKDNRHLAYGFLTGILRVAKESIFSGLNNLSVNSVLEKSYSEYFGFTASEVQKMAEDYGHPEKFSEICEWYDGYRFGSTDIFNPWSVINYFANNCEARAYWLSTGNNDTIGAVIQEADAGIREHLAALVNGTSFATYIDPAVVYPEIKKNPVSVYSFLLSAGYLKAVRTSVSVNGDIICEVALPNKEVALVYRHEILQKLEPMIPRSAALSIEEAFYSGNAGQLQDSLRQLLMQSASSFDTAGENFYHGFMLGLCALMGNFYVTSNRESGEGRYDLALYPKKETLPGILIELKWGRDLQEDTLQLLAEKALTQIREKHYDTDMRMKGIHPIWAYGVAFRGKTVAVTVESLA